MSQIFNVDKEMEWYRDRPLYNKVNNYVKKEIPATGRKPNKKPKPIDQYDMNGNFIDSHESVKAAAEKLFISTAAIYNMLIGNATHAKGFVFKYKVEVK